VNPRKSAFLLIALLILLPLLLGTNSCQENYKFAPGTNAGGSPTVVVTGSPTVAPDDDPSDDDIVTRTATPMGTVSVTPTIAGTTNQLTPTINPTIQPLTPTVQVNALMNGIVKDLKNDQASAGSVRQDASSLSSRSVLGGSNEGNWLGSAFDKDKNKDEPDSSWKDSDNDGFSDNFERENGSDLKDPNSTPNYEQSGSVEDVSLNRKLIEKDENENGCADLAEEYANDFSLNSSLNNNSIDVNNNSIDEDNDCLTLAVENDLNSSDQLDDSDKDGLTDDVELAYGTNLNSPDSDGDGVSDLTEIILGGNPLIAQEK
jgi:Bacterial TSP3 repeat